jgi:hypothetical protein
VGTRQARALNKQYIEFFSRVPAAHVFTPFIERDGLVMRGNRAAVLTTLPLIMCVPELMEDLRACPDASVELENPIVVSASLHIRKLTRHDLAALVERLTIVSTKPDTLFDMVGSHMLADGEPCSSAMLLATSALSELTPDACAYIASRNDPREIWAMPLQQAVQAMRTTYAEARKRAQAIGDLRIW